MYRDVLYFPIRKWFLISMIIYVIAVCLPLYMFFGWGAVLLAWITFMAVMHILGVGLFPNRGSLKEFF